MVELGGEHHLFVNMREREREKHFGRFWFFNFGVDVVCMNNIIIDTSPFYILL